MNHLRIYFITPYESIALLRNAPWEKLTFATTRCFNSLPRSIVSELGRLLLGKLFQACCIFPVHLHTIRIVYLSTGASSRGGSTSTHSFLPKFVRIACRGLVRMPSRKVVQTPSKNAEIKMLAAPNFHSFSLDTRRIDT